MYADEITPWTASKPAPAFFQRRIVSEGAPPKPLEPPKNLLELQIRDGQENVEASESGEGDNNTTPLPPSVDQPNIEEEEKSNQEEPEPATAAQVFMSTILFQKMSGTETGGPQKSILIAVFPRFSGQDLDLVGVVNLVS